MTVSTEIQLSKPKSLAPTNMQEAIQFAEMVAHSQFAPKGFQGKPGDVLVAIQMGMEVGLPPMAALQNIAVINGRPSIWGAAALAVVKAHPDCKGVIEIYDPDTRTAVCLIQRRNQHDVERTFSWADACQAGYDKKPGPWQTHPKRMLQMRARGFAMNDQFPDALKGLFVREESEDIPVEPVAARRFAQTGDHGPRLMPMSDGNADVANDYIARIRAATTRDELVTLFREAREAGGWSAHDAGFAPVVAACKAKTDELAAVTENPPLDVEYREPGADG